MSTRTTVILALGAATAFGVWYWFAALKLGRPSLRTQWRDRQLRRYQEQMLREQRARMGQAP